MSRAERTIRGHVVLVGPLFFATASLVLAQTAAQTETLNVTLQLGSLAESIDVQADRGLGTTRWPARSCQSAISDSLRPNA
jgi:hypothetical protein